MSTNKLATPYKQGLLGPGPQTIGGAKTFTDPGVFSVNSSSTALRITQAGAGNALVVEDSTTPDSTPFVIDASGSVVVGHTSPIETFPTFSPKVQVHGTGPSGSSGVNSTHWDSNPARRPQVFLNKSLGTSVGSHVAVTSGAVLGDYVACGSDGTKFVSSTLIRSEADATFTTDSAPGRLLFSTTASGSTTLTERMRIDNQGRVGIGTTNPTAQLHLGAKLGVADSATVCLDEKDTTPANPSSGNQAKIYLKADKLILQYNDAGTVRYKYLDLTGTGVTWVHTTTAP